MHPSKAASSPQSAQDFEVEDLILAARGLGTPLPLVLLFALADFGLASFLGVDSPQFLLLCLSVFVTQAHEVLESVPKLRRAGFCQITVILCAVGGLNQLVVDPGLEVRELGNAFLHTSDGEASSRKTDHVRSRSCPDHQHPGVGRAVNLAKGVGDERMLLSDVHHLAIVSKNLLASVWAVDQVVPVEGTVPVLGESSPSGFYGGFVTHQDQLNRRDPFIGANTVDLGFRNVQGVDVGEPILVHGISDPVSITGTNHQGQSEILALIGQTKKREEMAKFLVGQFLVPVVHGVVLGQSQTKWHIPVDQS